MKSSYSGSESAVGCIALGLVIIALVVGALLLGSFILMVVWNAVVPAVFGLSALTFPMAIALNVLLSFLGGVFRRVSK